VISSFCFCVAGLVKLLGSVGLLNAFIVWVRGSLKTCISYSVSVNE
jgi:hypothetical protein